jgi:hypothetical protein
MLANPMVTYVDNREIHNVPAQLPNYTLMRIVRLYGLGELYYRRDGVEQWAHAGGSVGLSVVGYRFRVPGLDALYGCYTRAEGGAQFGINVIAPLPATLKVNENANRVCGQAHDTNSVPSRTAPAIWNWVTVVLPSARPGRANVCIGVGGFGDSFACARIDQSGNIDADTVLWVME